MAQKLTKTWSLGYIIEHWTRVIAIAVLTFTGFYIHWPFIAGGLECLLMSWMRFFHFIAAYVLTLGLVVRLYMAFRSTFDADWQDFGIIRNIKNIPDILGYYLFIKGSHKDYRKYNPLQALIYLCVAAVIVVAALTGGALYQGNIFGFIQAPDSFLWVTALLGGDPATRSVHILSMWFFIVFVLIHVYMSIMTTMVNKDKTLTSILTGYKLKKFSK